MTDTYVCLSSSGLCLSHSLVCCPPSISVHLSPVASGDRAEAMRGEGLLQKLLFQLCDPTVTVRKVKLVTCIITRLLREHFATGDISRYYGRQPHVHIVNEELPEMSCIQMLI